MVVLVVPYMLWAALPAWHTLLAILAALSLMAVAIELRRRSRRAGAQRATLPSNSDWLWRPAWDSPQYAARLATFLRASSWHIEAARIIGPDRISMIVRRDRISAALLCLRPGQPIRHADLATLHSLQQAHMNDHAVLIGDGQPPNDYPGLPTVLFLSPGALRHLDDCVV